MSGGLTQTIRGAPPPPPPPPHPDTDSVKKEMWGLINAKLPYLSGNILRELCWALGILIEAMVVKAD